MSELFKNTLNTTVIPTKVASEISGYNTDYLARLCREKKIEGTQVGRSWLINRTSLEEFVKSQQERKKERSAELSALREVEYKKAQETPKDDIVNSDTPARVLLPSPYHQRPVVPVTSRPLFAVAVSLAVMATGAYASTDAGIAKQISIAPERISELATIAVPQLIASSQLLPSEVAATTSRSQYIVTDIRGYVQGVPHAFAEVGTASMHEYFAFVDAERASSAAAESAKISYPRISHRAFDAVMSGNVSFSSATDALLDSYERSISAWTDMSPKLAGTVVLSAYSIGSSLDSIALRTPDTITSVKDHSAQLAVDTSYAIATTVTGAESRSIASIADGTSSARASSLGAIGYAASALRGPDTNSETSVSAETLTAGLGFLPASWELGIENTLESGRIFALNLFTSVLRSLASLMPGGDIVAPTLTVIPLPQSEPFVMNLPIQTTYSTTTTYTQNGIPVPASIIGGTTISTLIQNYYPQTVIGSTLNDAVLAIVRPFVRDSIEAALKNHDDDDNDSGSNDGGVSSDGATLTNVDIQSGNASLTSVTTDSLTAGSSTLATTTVNGDLTVNGTLTADTLTVSNLSSNAAVIAPFFTATATNATSSFTNIAATNANIANATTSALYTSNFGLSGSYFTSLLGTGLSNVNGSLSISTTSFSGAGSNFNADRLDGLDSTYLLANSFSTTSAQYFISQNPTSVGFSTTSADYWKTQRDFFSTTSVNYWKSVTDFFSTTSSNAWLATKSTDNLSEGATNLYFTNARADARIGAASSTIRGMFSNTATGITYNPATGAFSLTSGYTIPLTSSTTEWSSAYANRITAANAPLSITNNTLSISQATGSTNGYLSSADFNTFNNKQAALTFAYPLINTSNTISLAFGTTTANTWSQLQTFGAGINVGASTFTSLLGTGLANVGGTLTVSTTSFSGTGSNFNADLIDGLDSAYLIANSFSTSSADAWKATRNFFSTTSADSWLTGKTTSNLAEGSNLYYTQARFDTAFGAKSTSDLSEGANLYFTNARADARIGAASSTIRGMFSSTATGLTYNPATGAFTLTNGYTIPLSASTTEWDSAYANRITSATSPLSLANNTLSISQASGSTNGYLTSVDWNSFNSRLSTTTLGLIDKGYFFSSSSAAYYISQNQGTSFSTTSASAFLNTYDKGYFYSTTSANYWLTTKTTDNLSEGSTNLYYTQARFNSAFAGKTTTDLAEGTNLYFTDARADARIGAASSTVRGMISNTATGLTYNPATGAFSLTSGYTIPLTASTTEWNSAYGSRISSATYPILFANNVLSLAFGTTTANTWSQLQTFGAGINVGASTFTSLLGTGLANVGGTLTVSTTSFSGTGSNFNADLIDGLDSAYLIANSFSTSSADAWKATRNFFSTTSADSWLTGKTTDNLSEGATNLYYSNTRARAALSSTATGLTYNSGTGVFSLTGGYTIPLTASTTDWNTAYANRITAANAPLSLSNNTLSISQASLTTNGYLSSADFTIFNNKQSALTFTYPIVNSSNVVSLAFGTTTSNTWAGTQTFTNGIVVQNATSSFTGNLEVGGNIIPALNDTYTLGRPDRVWRDVYIGPGSLYVDGQKVLQTDASDNVVVSSDPNQNLIFRTTGTSNLELNPTGGQVLLKNTVNISAGKSIITSDLSALPIPNGVAAGNITVSGNSIAAGNLNGGISITPNGTGNTYITAGNFGIGTTSPSFKLEVNGNSFINGNETITGTAKVGSLSGLIYGNSGVLSVATVTSPLSFTGGTLSISTSGDWTGTFDGQEGSYYLANSFSSTSAAYYLSQTSTTGFSTTSANYWLTTKSTTNLAEGTNLYFTNARADARINATSTIGTLTSAPNLGTVSTALNGILRATSGVLSTSLISLTSDVTGTLPSNNGGTGFSTYTTGDMLYADVTGSLVKLPIGSPGQVLKVQGGVPSWGLDQTIGGGASDGIFATSSGKIYPLDTASVVLFGTNSTSTNNSIFEVNDQQYISTRLAIATTSPSAALSVGGNALISGSVNAGSLILGGSTFTSLLGSGLSNVAGALTLDRTGDWTGTFDGQEGSYYLANSFSSTSAAYYLTQNQSASFSTTSANYWLTTKSTTDLAEGTNLYFTNARADARIAAASSTIRGMFSNTATGLTYNSTTGVTSLTAGYTIPLTASTTDWNTAYINRISSVTYPLQLSSNVLSLAFGTTTANTWSALQTFSAGVNIGGSTFTSLLGSGLSNVAGALSVSTSTFSGSGSNFNADLLDGLDGSYYLANSFSSTSAAYYLSQNQGASFSTTSAAAFLNTYDKGYFYSTTSANYWLTTKSTTNLTEGTNLYYTDARSRAALSSSATGLTYNNTNGIFSLTSGYTIPLTASTTDWNTAYTSRISSATYPIQFSNNVLSLAFGTTTANTWSQLQTFNGGFTATNATTTNIAVTGLSANTLVYANGIKQLSSVTLGSGLTFTGGTLSLDRTGDWTGTFDGQEGSYYLANSFSSTSAAYYLSQNQGSSFSTTSAAAFLNTYDKGYFYSTTSANYWLTTKSTTNLTEGTNLYYTDARVQTFLNSVDKGNFFSTTSANAYFATKSTNNLAEGGTNLYFTNARAQAAISVAGLPLTYSAGVIGINQASGAQAGYITAADYTSFSGKQAALTFTYPLVNSANTVSLAFGTTTANTWSALQTFNGGASTTQITASGLIYAGNIINNGLTANTLIYANASKQEASVTLGSGLTFTGGTLSVDGGASFSTTSAAAFLNTYDKGYFYSTTSANYWLTTKSTTNLTEGTNLYYTDARVQTFLNSVDKGNFFSTTSANAYFATKSTNNLAEGGTNLYYTDARVQAYLNSVDKGYFFSSTSANAYFATKNTDNLTEGSTNLYFTNARARAAISATSPIAYNNTTGVISIPQANGSTNGYLSSTDFNTFNNKQSALTFTYPLVNSANTVSLAFGTTTANTWSSLQTFTSGVNIGGSTFTSLLGSGLSNVGGTLTVDSGASFSTTSAAAFLNTYDKGYFYSTTSANYWLTTKSTTNLSEGTNLYYTDARARAALSAGTGLSYNASTGVFTNAGVLSFNSRTGAVVPTSGDYTTAQVTESGNLYFTDARADARINATSTIGTLTSAPNLGTVKTTLTGILKATSGVLTSATAGTDFQAPLTFTYPLVNSANTVSLAFGTTTANTWSSLQTFTSGVNIGGSTFTSLLGSGLSNVGGTLTVDGGASFSSTSAAAFLNTYDKGYFFSTTSANAYFATKSTTNLAEGTNLYYTDARVQTFLNSLDKGNFFSTTSANAYFATKNTDNLTEGSTNLYFTNARARAAISSTATGLTYTSGTGVFSLTSGYTIPLTASTTDWNTAYNSRISSATYPIQFSNNVLSLAFGTTTANTWSSLQTFTSGVNIGGSTFTSLLGSGLSNVGGTLTLDRTGDWTGTFDGQEGSYYLANSFSSTSAAYYLSQNQATSFSTTSAAAFLNTYDKGYFYSTTSANYWLTTKSTTNLAEGTNLYYTQARFDTAFAGKSTTNLAEGTNLYFTNARAQAAISVSGLPLTYSAGVIGINQASGAQAGYITAADYTSFSGKQAPLTFTYPLVNTANTVSLAFGTTTANTWSALQTFSAGVNVGGSTFTSLLGSGLSNVGGTLTVDGGASFSTTSANYFINSSSTIPNPAGGAYGNVIIWNGSRYITTATSTLAVALADTTGTLSVNRGGTGSTTLGGLLSGNGTGAVTSATVSTASGITFSGNTLSLASIPNSSLANSTISGIALGNNLANLTATDSTLTFSGSYNGGTARTVGLNLANANTWTALQQFNGGASTTQLTTTGTTYLATAGGNVSVGPISTVNTNLVVSGSGAAFNTNGFGQLAIRNSTSGADLGGGVVFGSTAGAHASISGFSIAGGQAGYMAFYTTSGSILNERMRISSGGNVGIGTTTPLGMLHVSNGASGVNPSGGGDDLVVESASNTGISIIGTTDLSILFGNPTTAANDGRLAYDSVARSMQFWTAGLPRVLIDSSGRLGIGTTSPFAPLSVTGDFALTGGIYANGTRGTNGQFLQSTGTGVQWVSTSTLGLVTSVFGRTGAVIAQSGDYTTAQVTESGNLYFTNARADARINATSTIGTLTSAPNLATISTALNGILKATSGVLSSATAGTDYQAPLSFTYPLVNSANTVSLAFGTTTANTWSSLQTFTSGVNIGGSTFTSLLGSGLSNVGGTLTVDGGASFSSTSAAAFLNTYDKGYFFSTTSANAYFSTKSTDNLTEGATNLYYTQARFNTAFAGKSTTDLAEGTNLYFTNTRAQGAISVAGLPLTYSAGVIGINQASGAQAGYITAADYTSFSGKQAPLTFTYPLVNSANTVSLAFGTTTANTWSSLQTFTSGVNIGGSTFTSLLGSGLTNSAGTLTLDRTGDWTGTFDGQEGSYYLANSFSSTSAAYYLSQTNTTGFSTTSANYWLTTKSTTDLAEGSNLYYTQARFDTAFAGKSTTDLAEGTNLYFTNTRADARINATSTIGTLTSAPNLGTVSTALNGILKATSGVLSSATAGTDYQAPLTFTYPLVNSANTVSLAFGTTTANTWSALQTFGGGFVSQGSSTVTSDLTVGGSGYFTGPVSIGTTTPDAALTIAGVNATQLHIYRGTAANNSIQFENTLGSWYQGINANGDFAVRYNNSNIGGNPNFTILTNGNVGISSTTPGVTLGVGGNALINGFLTIGGALRVGSLTASRAMFTDATNGIVSTALSSALANSLTDEQGSGSVVFATSPTFTTQITAPIVYGGITAASTLTLRGYTAAAPTTAAVILGAGTTEIARVAAGGVGIGTTTPAWNLTVSSSTRPQLALTDASATGSIWSFRTQFNNLYIGSTSPTTYATATVASMTFANDGGIVLGAPTGGSKGLGTLNATTVYANNVALTSDARYKTNVQNLNTSTGLDLIRQLRPVSYSWIDPKMGTQNQLGFIAQEVQQLAPELVEVGNDKDHTLALNYIGLISPAVQAIQQLALQGDSLSLATSTLSVRISELESRIATSVQTMPKPLSATIITAESMQIANGVSAGTMTMQSANVDGTISASRYVVPQTASTFAMGSTTMSATLPDDVVTSGGMVDLYKLASYGVASVQALASRTDLLTVRIDDIESRLAALETLQVEDANTASSTDDTGMISGTLSGLKTMLASLGIVVKDGFTMINKLVTTQLVFTDGEDGTSSTGTEVVTAGTTELEVLNPLVHPSSKIFLTFTASVDGPWYIAEKKEGSFTIKLANAQPYDTEFDYFLIQTDPNAQVAGAAQATPEPPAGIPEAPTTPETVPEDGGPSMSLVGNAAIQIPQGAPWTDPGATATAADGTDLTSGITVSGSVDSDTAGLYTVTYNVTDAAGKQGQVSRVVTVLAPTMTPSEPPAVAETPSDNNVPTGGTEGSGESAAAPDGTPAS